MANEFTELWFNLANLDDPSERCFLCATRLSAENQTQEHIIPSWAQSRYKLADQRLTLLNQTQIPYRQLTVPCCDDCNRSRLRPIEDAMSSAVDEGKIAVDRLGATVPFLWLSKILYGLLYKEMTLLQDRSSASAGRIVEPAFLQHYQSLRLFLQQARGLVKPVGFSPGSIFTFKMQPLSRKEFRWDFCDDIMTLFVGCRVGSVGLIGVLGDGGAQQEVVREHADFQDLELHPIQFRELCAQFLYRSMLLNRTPKYSTVASETSTLTVQMPLGGFLRKPLFEEWVPEDYARVLDHLTGAGMNFLFKPPDEVWTWLRDEAGKPNYLRFEDS